MLKLSHLLHLDFFSALGALAWAVAAMYVAGLEDLVSSEAAFTFAAVAAARWQVYVRTKVVKDGG